MVAINNTFNFNANTVDLDKVRDVLNEIANRMNLVAVTSKLVGASLGNTVSGAINNLNTLKASLQGISQVFANLANAKLPTGSLNLNIASTAFDAAANAMTNAVTSFNNIVTALNNLSQTLGSRGGGGGGGGGSVNGAAGGSGGSGYLYVLYWE